MKSVSHSLTLLFLFRGLCREIVTLVYKLVLKQAHTDGTDYEFCQQDKTIMEPTDVSEK